jgi:carboxypeptidase Taq
MEPTKLLELSREITTIQHMLALLHWDQETYIVDRGHEDRAKQISFLTALVHGKETSKELSDEIEHNLTNFTPGDHSYELARVMKRNFDFATKLPTEFVLEKAQTISNSLKHWSDAREKNDFSLFQPWLKKMIELTRRECEYIGYQGHPYNALLDVYSEGLTTGIVEKNFEVLKKELPSIIANQKCVEDLEMKITIEDQKKLTELLLKENGIDFAEFRQDDSRHPFMTKLGSHDFRVTNTFHENTLKSVWSALHEGGHALYEMGINSEFNDNDLSSNLSLIIHESQSRFWEKVIGFSDEYWECMFQKITPFITFSKPISLSEFTQWVRRVKPGLIRIDSDELCYDLHVVIRFEIEKLLIKGELEVEGIEEKWNSMYKEYLGVEVPNLAQGCLQDIHWAHGSFGYFPTYTLGNIFASQVWEAYCVFDPEYKNTISTGQLSKITHWLKENIHQYGSSKTPTEIIHHIDPAGLNPTAYIKRLKRRYATYETA